MTPAQLDDLWGQLVWNGRVTVLVLIALAGIIVLKVVIYRITVSLLREVRSTVADVRALLLDVGALLTATKAHSAVAVVVAEQAATAAGKMEQVAATAVCKLEQAAATAAWHPGDPDRRAPAGP